MDGENVENEQVTVSENKFNGTSTLDVIAPNVEYAKMFARRFWREEYGSRPSRVVAEKKDYRLSQCSFTVMVADHSSGSLKETKQYEYESE